MQAQTVEFVSQLFNVPALRPLLDTLPEVFIQQAREGATSFYLDSSLLSRRQYAFEDGSRDLFRVVLEDPYLYESGDVAVKFRLSGRMDANGQMIPLRPGGNTNDGGQWLKGFRSLAVVFNDHSVAEGILSIDDMNALRAYAETWEQIIEDHGENAPYSTEFGNTRLWITPSSPEALITFNMAVRQNLNKNTEYTLGIQDVAWKDCALIGKGTTGNAQAPARASSVSFVTPSVDIPTFKRGSLGGGNTNPGTSGGSSRRARSTRK